MFSDHSTLYGERDMKQSNTDSRTGTNTSGASDTISAISTISVGELPHDLLAEKSLLGCLLIDGHAHDEIVDLSLKKEDFYHPQYRIVFECIQDLILASRPIDYVTVCTRLADVGRIDSLGVGDLRGQAFILNLVEEQASSANVYYYGKTVKDKAVLRNIIKTAERVSKEARAYSGDTRELISSVESSFFKINQEIRNGGIKKLSACLAENLAELESGQRNFGEYSGILTGYNHLDDKLLGLQPGQLVIIAARPAMGKTALGLNIAVNSSKRHKLPVMVFSLEMMTNELGMRMLSSYSKIEFKKLRAKNLDENDLKKIGRSIQQLASYPVYICDDGHVNLLDIQSECRKLKAEYGLGLVVVDYVQLLRPHTNNPHREQQISEISRGLKSMAKELSCPVIALSQLNRGVESRVDKRPMVSDLRESGALEQDADIVLLIYRDEFYFPETSKEKGIAEVIIGKNRSGESGTVRLAFNGIYTSFDNLTRNFYDEQSLPHGSNNHQEYYVE